MRNWISLPQFCALTGQHPETVRKKIRDNRLQAIKVGGRYRISMDEYERYKREGYLSNSIPGSTPNPTPPDEGS
jgi:excisionase family DNA binding protein